MFQVQEGEIQEYSNQKEKYASILWILCWKMVHTTEMKTFILHKNVFCTPLSHADRIWCIDEKEEKAGRLLSIILIVA